VVEKTGCRKCFNQITTRPLLLGAGGSCESELVMGPPSGVVDRKLENHGARFAILGRPYPKPGYQRSAAASSRAGFGLLAYGAPPRGRGAAVFRGEAARQQREKSRVVYQRRSFLASASSLTAGLRPRIGDAALADWPARAGPGPGVSTAESGVINVIKKRWRCRGPPRVVGSRSSRTQPRAVGGGDLIRLPTDTCTPPIFLAILDEGLLLGANQAKKKQPPGGTTCRARLLVCFFLRTR